MKKQRGIWSMGLIVGVVICVGGILQAHEGHDHGKEAAVVAQDKTIEGEILDLACYIGHGEKGRKHADCAKKCAKGGSPIGLLTGDGTVYLLVNDHANEKSFEEAKSLAGEPVKITGKVSKKGGLPTIVVEKVEKAK